VSTTWRIDAVHLSGKKESFWEWNEKVALAYFDSLQTVEKFASMTLVTVETTDTTIRNWTRGTDAQENV
jgi:hypothetical protein